MTRSVHLASQAGVDDVQARKVVRAAHQFEAVLLNSLLGSLEQSFSMLPGDKLQGESENYRYMGMQALAGALAERGAIGIADMIVRSLQGVGQQPHSHK